MPSILSHTYVALRALDDLENTEMKSIILNGLQAFTTGAQGPDIWLYYEALPWQDKEESKFGDWVSNKVHSEKTNEFFLSFLKTIRQTEDESLKERMIAYSCGHLAHWALDMIAHPYIFYRTDGKSSGTEYWHSRMEGMIDNYMAEAMNEQGLKYMPIKTLIACDDLSIKAIGRLYSRPLMEIWNDEIDEKMVAVALKDFRSILGLTAGRHPFLFRIVRWHEMKKGCPWKMTSHFITLDKDSSFDVMNMQRQEWEYPSDSSKKMDSTFYQMCDEAIRLSKEAISAFCRAVQEPSSEEKLLQILGNRNYLTGSDHPEKMFNFNIIYQNKQ